MRKSFFSFFKIRFADLFEALFNLVIFLPYFFSVGHLFKTLFLPWKNLVSKKTVRGFSFSEWFNRIFFNAVSSGIGFFMRLSIIIFYFFVFSAYILLFPLTIIVSTVSMPFFYLLYMLQPTEEEKKVALRQNFLASHLLKPENQAYVEKWFEDYYHTYHLHSSWWKLKNLFSLPPLARDWAYGYTPGLDEFCLDMSSETYQDKIKTAFDRQNEIVHIERVLSKTNEANVLLVGEEGVGKHTIVDAFAKKIYEGKTTSLLAYKRLLKLDMAKILSRYTDQKQRENFFDGLLKEACEAKNIILMIDGLDRYVDKSRNETDLSSILEKYARTDQIQIIGITDPFAYQKYVFANEKVNRIFEKVDVSEIDKQNAKNILLKAVFVFESRYSLSITYEAVETTVEKSDYYITYIPFPEKAIELLDLTCIYAKKNNMKIVSPDIVDQILTEKTHIPTTVTDSMRSKLLNLESLLKEKIVQQDTAIDELSQALRRSFLLIGKRKKPLACFLFLGPTGVGKTETAKTIASTFFGSDKYLIRFDMSLYQSKNDIPTLIGSADNNNPGLLSKALRENPYGVLLLDEIEKADKDLLNIFLTMLDEGYFTDAFGKRVDGKNLVIIATSNAGSDIIFKENVAGHSLVNLLVEKRVFSPEFLNRFDGIISFSPLEFAAVAKIAKKMIDRINIDIDNLYKVKLEVSDAFLNEILKQGYDSKFGARDIERIIRKRIEDSVARLILENKVKEGDIIRL
jgi:ATP-dependent Clp protease ATP-binding subunit ClpC